MGLRDVVVQASTDSLLFRDEALRSVPYLRYVAMANCLSLSRYSLIDPADGPVLLIAKPNVEVYSVCLLRGH